MCQSFAIAISMKIQTYKLTLEGVDGRGGLGNRGRSESFISQVCIKIKEK